MIGSRRARASASSTNWPTIARPAAQRDYAAPARAGCGASDRSANSGAAMVSILRAATDPHARNTSSMPKKCASYFAYNNVRDGIFQLTQRSVRRRDSALGERAESGTQALKRIKCSINGQLIGRFFLDMHPREGKFNHAAQFPVRISAHATARVVPIGRAGVQFPRRRRGTTGLMEHAQVETFLHEFGHLLHSHLRRAVSNGRSSITAKSKAISSKRRQHSWKNGSGITTRFRASPSTRKARPSRARSWSA